MGDNLSRAINDHHIRRNWRAAQYLLNLLLASPCHLTCELSPQHFQNLLRRVGRLHFFVKIFGSEFCQPFKINLAAPRMQIHGPLRQLGNFSKATADGDAGDRMLAHILQ